MGAPDKIKTLVESFHSNLDAYKSNKKNETELRREYLDPFFTELGWDVANDKTYADAYKDVVHEFSIKTKKGIEFPDYCFRIGQTPKFFVEAKQPSVNVKDDVKPALQVRGYGWSAKHPLSILTDFEEFAVYDCRIPPNKNDKASVARVMLITYDQYIDKWNDIASVFSRQAILKGSFDKYVESNKKKKGTAEVDEVFLKQMEEWRKSLAKNIALRNPQLNIRELNYAVQKTIDRIIFLRICEDRGIEEYGQLLSLQTGTNIYQTLKQIFHRADEKYNSGLFHFEKEKDRTEPPDNLTLDLSIDDKTIKEIVKELYYPESQFKFSVIPADILGQVYEQFLGKVIRLTAGHQAIIDDKPEVKKAGGVYYTPTYIVDYIVNNTIGKLISPLSERGDKGGFQNPKQVTTLKILDPACGSGSFLLGAYQYLLDWHLKYYTNELTTNDKLLKQKQPPIYQTDKGNYLLTTSEKKRILLNNIYGVDIDPQAVEVTKLSLMLKVLEDESQQTLNNELQLFRVRALPDLSNNIKCGNSLIGPDFYDQMEMNFLDEEEKLRINVFDWHKEFPNVFNTPLLNKERGRGEVETNPQGFDIVIGNPPYLRIQGLQENYENQIKYFQSKYKSATKRFDLYLLFTERGYQLLNQNGKLGFICPHKFVNSDFGSGLRQYLLTTKALESIISFGNNLIFKDASTYTCLMFLEKNYKESFNYYEFNQFENSELQQDLLELNFQNFSKINFSSLSPEPWILTSTEIAKVLSTLNLQEHTIGDTFDKVFQGIVSGSDEIYFLKKNGIEDSVFVEVFSEREQSNVLIEKDVLVPILKGEDVKRYQKPLANYYCIYPYVLKSGKTVILEEKEFEEQYPKCYEYIKKYKNELRDLRIKYKTNPKYWYSCHRPRSISDFNLAKILTQEISLGCNMTIDNSKSYHNTTVYSLIPNKKLKENILFWLGIFNSQLMWWYLKNTGNVLRGGYFRFKTNYLTPFPLKCIDFSLSHEKAIHDRISDLVSQQLKLNTNLVSTKTPTERTAIERQIQATDTQIDQLVYQLYNLTPEEIKIVEGSE